MLCTPFKDSPGKTLFPIPALAVLNATEIADTAYEAGASERRK
jgi:hypothetical protein